MACKICGRGGHNIYAHRNWIIVSRYNSQGMCRFSGCADYLTDDELQVIERRWQIKYPEPLYEYMKGTHKKEHIERAVKYRFKKGVQS